MKVIYLCEKCGSVFSNLKGENCRCTDCQGDLIESWIAQDIWRNYSKEEKESAKIQIIEKKKQNDTQIQEASEKYNKIIITKTNNVEGRKINKYLGTVSGTDIYLVGGLLGGGLASQENLFCYSYGIAEKKMREKAVSLNADAIVGVQTSMVSPGGLNNIIVIVQGTAVKLSEDK